MTTPNHADAVQQRARELLASEYERENCALTADDIRQGLSHFERDIALRAIAAALTQPAASGEVVAEVVMAGPIPQKVLNFPGGMLPFVASHPVGTKLYTSPQPDADTVRDAERYRAWRMLAVTGTMSNWACERLIHARTETDIDAAIDSAIKGGK